VSEEAGIEPRTVATLALTITVFRLSYRRTATEEKKRGDRPQTNTITLDYYPRMKMSL
jgi:hypothetical protein